MKKEFEKIHLARPRMSDEGFELGYVQQAFDTNWIAPLGPNVTAFETEFADKLGVKDAVALSSGTAAIHLALKLAGVGEGNKPDIAKPRDTREDIVLCSSLTFAASVNPVVYQGATPVLIDSDWATWNMDPKALKAALEKFKGRIKAVVAAYLYGLLPDIDQILSLCDEYQVPLIEDAAESLGSTYDSYYYKSEGELRRSWHTTPIRLHAGTAGEIGCFSFNGNKIITTSGGGMLTANNPETAHKVCEKVRFWATQSRESAPWYQHQEVGYNYRLSNVSAGIGRGQLMVLDRHVQIKREIYEYYKENLEPSGRIRMMPVPEGVFPNYWLSCITFDQPIDPMDVYKHLNDNNIESRPIWKPMNLQPYYEHCTFITAQKSGNMGEQLFGRGLCLPSDLNMSRDDLNRIVNSIKEGIEGDAV
ncbi:MAG: DegT/DnrJ/EryC1/StrS family aminotransferase [Saccharofermentanales bacterium]